MFSPTYRITNRTLNNLIEVEVASKVVTLAELQPDWETRLKNESLVKRVFGSLKFSGNSLSLDDVSKMVRDEPGRDDKAQEVAMRVGIVGKEKDIQQVLNLLNVNRMIEQIAYLAGKFKHNDYGEKDLNQINALIGERLMSADKLGKIREKDEADEAVTSMPLAIEIPFQTEDLYAWFKGANKGEIHPVLKAGVMFYEILRICPFQENNLISALGFYQLILSTEGYGFKKLWSIEEEVLRNADSFQTAVMSVEKNGGDLTIWLEYLSRGLAEAAEKTQTKVMNLVGDAPIFKSDGGKVISLTERQIAVMEEMTLRNEMTIKEIRSFLPMVSDDTILRDLNGLIEKKLIRKKGKTKGAMYVMGKVRSFR